MRPFESGVQLESLAETKAAQAALMYTAAEIVPTSCGDFAPWLSWLSDEAGEMIDRFTTSNERLDTLHVYFTDAYDARLVLGALQTYLSAPESEPHKTTINTMLQGYMTHLITENL